VTTSRPFANEEPPGEETGLTSAIVFDLDPTFFVIPGIDRPIRYYGVVFAAMLYAGFLLWRWQTIRAGHKENVAEKWLWWGVIAVLLGSRLGHCLFYEPERYLSDPIRILEFWKGGLASHGATAGLVLAMFVFGRIYRIRWVEMLDRMAMPASVGACAVRLGNFLNSEIVGRVTDLPWAMKFPRYDCHGLGMCGLLRQEGYEDTSMWTALVERTPARHPSQLYELALGAGVLLALYLVDRRVGGERRPLGLLAGLFFTLYFAGRFAVEFVKEYQVDDLIASSSTLTMGQYLSVIPFLFGVGLLIYARLRRAPANLNGAAGAPPPPQPPQP